MPCKSIIQGFRELSKDTKPRNKFSNEAYKHCLANELGMIPYISRERLSDRN